ncbi:hypothetical protein ACFQZ2_01650 [Streptomonospora algeriensis]|uniref:Uncharacterized protein n=1 Tax=Streptomonospora algeriensis TaxID=995084 RepID=A0ABW3B9A1_9ACTN
MTRKEGRRTRSASPEEAGDEFVAPVKGEVGADADLHATRIPLQGTARDYGALLAHHEAMEHAHLHASTAMK